MLNLTVVSLCSSSFLGVSLPVRRGVGEVSVFRSHFSRLAHPVVFSSSPAVRCYLSQSSFVNLIERAMYVDERKQAVENLVVTSFVNSTVDCCVFRELGNADKSGGAILSFGPLVVTRSVFERCSGKEGGAVVCFSALKLAQCSFLACTAYSAGAWKVTAPKFDTDMEFCTFLSCSATFFACFYRSSDGWLTISNTNMTRSTVQECVACFETNGGVMKMTHSLMQESEARVHNGGFCGRGQFLMTIELCAFVKNRHHSAERNAGAVALFYNNPPKSRLKECAFVDNYPDQSYTVSVADGFPLTFDRCCFTGSAAKEVNVPMQVFHDCTFAETSCGATFSLTAEPIQHCPDDTLPLLFRRRRWLISALIAAVLASAFTCIHAWLTNARAKPKTPQALL